MTSLISWGVCIVLAFVMYAMNANEAKFKKNIAVGVTFPRAGREDPEVQGLLKGFKREQLVLCLAMTALGVLCAALTWPDMSFCLFCLWVDLLIVAEFVSSARWNGKLRAVKKARGWTAPGIRTASVTAAAAPPERVSAWWFIAAAAAAVVPAALDRELWVMYALDAALALCCWPGARYLYRNRAETVDEDEAVTAALTRVRRRTWDRMWVMLAWTMAAVNAGVWLSTTYFSRSMVLFWLTGGLGLGVCAVAVGLEFRVRHIQEKLTAASGEGFYVDEDDKWLFGQLYYDPDDRRVIINSRTGVNSTVNLARPGGKAFMVLVLALLLGMPAMGLCVDTMSKAPLPLRIEDGVLLAESWGKDYAMPVDEIAQVELIDENPDDQGPLVGVRADAIRKGKIHTEWGDAMLCLDPRTGPWLKVIMQDGAIYILGGGDSGAEAVYEALTQ